MYERSQSGSIERASSKTGSTGIVQGILATDGEASDGHILAIEGGEFRSGAPLLFGHDDRDGNLGSWSDFNPSGGVLRGRAQIELGGAGARAEWRADVAHMIENGHIGAFSIRWDPIGEPTSRTALSPDHPAYVDPDRETEFRKLYGFHFDKWRMLEGSVVTLPADQAALIGRARSGDGSADYWNRVLARMAGVPMDDRTPLERAVAESFADIALDELEPVELSDGRTYFVPAELARRDEILELSETEIEEPGEMPDPVEREAPKPLSREAMVDLFKTEVAPVYSDVRNEWGEIADLFREEIAAMQNGLRKEYEDLLYEALGRVR